MTHKQRNKLMAPTLVPLSATPWRKLRKATSSAYVVFLDSSSLERALVSTSKPRTWPTSSDEPSGLAHNHALYDSLRPPLDDVRAFSVSSIEVYEYEREKRKQKSKYHKGEAIIDADGFTFVTRGGAYGKMLGGGVAVASKRFQRSGQAARNRSNKKEKKKTEGFHAFQKQRNCDWVCIFPSKSNSP